MMKRNLCFSIAIISLIGCCPKLEGDLKVYNDSSEEIVIKHEEIAPNNSISDTNTVVIAAGQSAVLKVLSGISGDSFNCCSCETGIYSISTLKGKINRDFSIESAWKEEGKSKKNKWGKETVRCELHVTQKDLK